MSKLLVLGAGTAGTMIANKLRRRLGDSWQITVVDRDDEHHYQPGYLFVPFGTYTREQVVRSRGHYLTAGIELVLADIDRVDTDRNLVELADGRHLDQLICRTEVL